MAAWESLLCSCLMSPPAFDLNTENRVNVWMRARSQFTVWSEFADCWRTRLKIEVWTWGEQLSSVSHFHIFSEILKFHYTETWYEYYSTKLLQSQINARFLHFLDRMRLVLIASSGLQNEIWFCCLVVTSTILCCTVVPYLLEKVQAA